MGLWRGGGSLEVIGILIWLVESHWRRGGGWWVLGKFKWGYLGLLGVVVWMVVNRYESLWVVAWFSITCQKKGGRYIKND